MRLIIVGLPSSGKTTFLGALAHVLSSDEVDGALRLARVQPDESYVNRIREEWLTFREAQRTSGVNSFALAVDFDGTETVVEVPDVSGEICRDAWTLRAWPSTFDDVASAADATLVFLHAGKLVKGFALSPTIQSIVTLAAALHESPRASLPFDPEKAPTQVRIVDLLQMLAIRNDIKSRIVVLISAWDKVRTHKAAPRKWLASNAPFLLAHLEANEGRSPFRVYGVSALGGDLQEMRDKAAEYSVASDRISIVTDGEGPHHDITAPLKWILSYAAP